MHLHWTMLYRFDMLMSCWQILYGKETMTYLVLMNNLWVRFFIFLNSSVCKLSLVKCSYHPSLLSSPNALIKWYNFTMVAYCWECQQALCRETYFRIGLPFTTGPIWLAKTFITCDRNFIWSFSMDVWHGNSFIDKKFLSLRICGSFF